jgi:hypothetical protein
MDNQRPKDLSPPSPEVTEENGKDERPNRDLNRKMFPYSVKEIAKAKAAGK